MNSRGFTLIEILIAISIVAVLSGIGLVSYSAAQKSAQKAKVADDFAAIQTNIDIARRAANSNLMTLTGTGWSEGSCTGGIDVRSQACVDRMTLSFSRLNNSPLQRDPWGNPYLFNENEGEQASNPCVPDILRSAGPDHIIYTSDDISFNVSYYFCQ